MTERYPRRVNDDRTLVQIVDARLAEAAGRSGHWLACHPGCCECCRGPFPISDADAQRLRTGLAELLSHDPHRASEIQRRAREWSGNDDEACPALDPANGTCELYAVRPMTCRTFGPPVRCESGELAICELCFDGASLEEIEAAVVDLDPEMLGQAEDENLTVAAVLRA